jgi:hypothetical protein
MKTYKYGEPHRNAWDVNMQTTDREHVLMDRMMNQGWSTLTHAEQEELRDWLRRRREENRIAAAVETYTREGQ